VCQLIPNSSAKASKSASWPTNTKVPVTLLRLF
jgi:hypothetical protein